MPLSMEKNYLFFDIECANCFNGVGKMCSFGYVLVDGDFTIIDTDDVVMNPEAEFDWYLFSPKNKCSLSYSKDYFRAHKNFEAYYKPIKKLLETAEGRVIGFGSTNDVGFLVSACERYNLPQINFSVTDIAPILNEKEGKKMGLSAWCEYYGIDMSNLKTHKSQDDAKMTMLLTKEFCTKNNIGIETLLEKNRGSRLSVEKYFEQREIKRHKDEVFEKIQLLTGRKCRALLSTKLHGDFALGFKIRENIDEAYKTADLIYRNGGILKKSLKSNGTLIVMAEPDENTKSTLASRSIIPMTKQQLYEKLGKS